MKTNMITVEGLRDALRRHLDEKQARTMYRDEIETLAAMDAVRAKEVCESQFRDRLHSPNSHERGMVLAESGLLMVRHAPGRLVVILGDSASRKLVADELSLPVALSLAECCRMDGDAWLGGELAASVVRRIPDSLPGVKANAASLMAAGGKTREAAEVLQSVIDSASASREAKLNAMSRAAKIGGPKTGDFLEKLKVAAGDRRSSPEDRLKFAAMLYSTGARALPARLAARKALGEIMGAAEKAGYSGPSGGSRHSVGEALGVFAAMDERMECAQLLMRAVRAGSSADEYLFAEGYRRICDAAAPDSVKAYFVEQAVEIANAQGGVSPVRILANVMRDDRDGKAAAVLRNIIHGDEEIDMIARLDAVSALHGLYGIAGEHPALRRIRIVEKSRDALSDITAVLSRSVRSPALGANDIAEKRRRDAVTHGIAMLGEAGSFSEMAEWAEKAVAIPGSCEVNDVCRNLLCVAGDAGEAFAERTLEISRAGFRLLAGEGREYEAKRQQEICNDARLKTNRVVFMRVG